MASHGKEVSAVEVQVPLWHTEMTPSSWGGHRSSKAGANQKYTEELEKLVQSLALIKGDVVDRGACLAISN